MKIDIKNEYVKKQLIKSLKLSASFSSFIGVFVALIPIDGKWWINILIIAGVSILSFTGVLIYLLSRKKRKIATCNNINVYAMYGDILKIQSNGFRDKPVVVIPVNSAFDYIVEDSLDVESPIVSPKTLHGKWILKMTNNDDAKIESLKSDIEKGIAASKLTIEKILDNKRGNQKEYRLGSTIFVEREECTYMLFALTDFDENNHVIERNVRTYSNLMNDFVNETSRCQGRDVFVPVMGVGLSLFGLDHKHAFEIMKATIINQKNVLKSSINIVIFDGDREKVSIYD